jgi:hypothetical protein
MDLKETEARNDCAGEAQQQLNRQTEIYNKLRVSRRHVLAVRW